MSLILDITCFLERMLSTTEKRDSTQIGLRKIELEDN